MIHDISVCVCVCVCECELPSGYSNENMKHVPPYTLYSSWNAVVDDKRVCILWKTWQRIRIPVHLHLSTLWLVASYNAVHRLAVWTNGLHGEPLVKTVGAERMATLVQSLGLCRGVETDATAGRQAVSVVWGRSVTCCQLFGRLVTCFHSFHHALESALDGGDLGVVDVDEVNVCETGGAAPTQIVKILYCRQVTLCTDLLGHSEYSC